MKLFNRVSRRIRSRGRKRPPFRLSFDLFEERRLLATFTVNSTADQFLEGTTTLRQAIEESNTTPGPNTIDFNIPGPGPFIIQPLTALPTITDQVNLDGTTERTFLGLPAAGPPVIQLNGNGLPGDGLVLGSAPPGESVSGTSSAGSTIIGLNIYNFTGGAGIHIQTNGNLVTGNFLGTDVNGTAAGPGNGDGVVIDNSASNNTIGGTGAGAGNVISGNSGDGIDISGDGNFVQGNKIGTDVMGSSSLGNQVAGVRILGSFNTIGGTGSGAGNVISGSKDEGVFVTGGNNSLMNNLIGTNAAGTVALGNGFSGITLLQSAGNTIGGNVISGNGVNQTSPGIFVGPGADQNVIQTNRIGTDSSGAMPLPNSGDGVDITNGSNNNTIGGTGVGAGNVISGNTFQGLNILTQNIQGVFQGVSPQGNQVLGNFIGTNAAGTAALGNGFAGISLDQTTGNVIRGNVISGNGVGPFGGDGISLTDSSSQGNLIQANLVGTDASGARALPNIGDGVSLASPNNTIGGTGSGAGNVISGNTGDGISVTGGNNSLLNNLIGTNAAGTVALGNGEAGISLDQTAGNVIRGNVVSGNGVGPLGGDGIDLTGSGSQGNLIQANRVGTDASGARALPNIGDGVSLASPNNTIGGTESGAGNVISGNSGDGIDISGDGNFVQGNKIGTDVMGSSSLGNQGAGVSISGSNNTIGGTGNGAGNVISGNKDEGISVTGGNNSLLNNLIGTNAAGTAALGNGLSGITLQQSAANTIGGNVISGNGVGPSGGDGISLAGASNNAVLGNYIGVGADGTTPLGNVLDGISLNNASSNSIIGNVVSHNGIGPNGIIQDAAGINLESNDLNNIIAGNKIGTDVSGNKALGNSLHGIFLGDGSSNNTIGGTAAGAGNLISGNGVFPITNRTSSSTLSTKGGVGVYINGANTSGNVVLNNYIGTNAEGTAALRNSAIGVLIYQSSLNTVGGTAAGDGNLISGNGFVGLEIAGGTDRGNLVQGNFIGTNAGGTAAIPNGTAAIPNGGDGIFINNAPNNTIGGTAAGAGNLISGNTFVGIELFGRFTSKNVIQGNKIGTDATGRLRLPNKVGGIFVITPFANQLGGTGPGQANQGQNIPIFGMPGLADPGSTSSVAARRRSRRGKATPVRTRAVVPSHPSGPSAHIPHHWSPSGGKKRAPHRV